MWWRETVILLQMCPFNLNSMPLTQCCQNQHPTGQASHNKLLLAVFGYTQDLLDSSEIIHGLIMSPLLIQNTYFTSVYAHNLGQGY